MASNPRDDESCDDAERPPRPSRFVEFDPETDSVTAALVRAVADLEGADPTELDPLYDALDPDALDALVRSVATRSTSGDVAVTVRYLGYAVSIHGYGLVEVAPWHPERES